MKPAPFRRFCTLGERMTVGQCALTEVAFDRKQLSEVSVELRAKAFEIFGNVPEIPASCFRVVVINKGREIGGTRLAAEQAVRLALTLEITRADPTETVYVFFGGSKARHGRVALRFARSAARRHGVNFVDDTKEGFTVVRHDGRRVRFEIFAASRGGDNIRGVPIVCAVLTEAAFYYDELSGVSNGEQIFAAIVPRLLPGGQIIIESTPWAEGVGLHWREFSRNFGAPTTALAALCPTLVMRDDEETRAMVAQEYERDADNAERELGAVHMAAGAGRFFDNFAVNQCPQPSLPLEIMPPHESEWRISAGYDPAYVRDSAEGVVVRTNGIIYEVAGVFRRTPQRGSPLVPSVVDSAFADFVKRHGGRTLATDIHYRESVREHVAGIGLTLIPSLEGKTTVFGTARELIHAGRVRWSEGHRRLTRQMLEVIAKPLAGGLVAISSPRRPGDHGDAAHALALALWCAATRGDGDFSKLGTRGPRQMAGGGRFEPGGF